MWYSRWIPGDWLIDCYADLWIGDGELHQAIGPQSRRPLSPGIFLRFTLLTSIRESWFNTGSIMSKSIHDPDEFERHLPKLTNANINCYQTVTCCNELIRIRLRVLVCPTPGPLRGLDNLNRWYLAPTRLTVARESEIMPPKKVLRTIPIPGINYKFFGSHPLGQIMKIREL